MRNNISLLFFCLICGNLFSQIDGYETRTWPFKLCVTSPNVLYGMQYADMQNLKVASNPNMFRNRMRMPMYEIIKIAAILDDHYVLGTQLGFSSRKKSPELESFIEMQNPSYHILNFKEQAHNFFVPRFFAGYRYTFNNSDEYPHIIGLMFYLNFDNYSYGSFSYEAKNVSDNSFHTYSLVTEVPMTKSLTIELEKYRYYQLKDSLKGLNIGVKFGVTPRNQEITLIESRRKGMETDQTITSSTFPLKSWTFYFGFQFSLVTTPRYYKKKK